MDNEKEELTILKACWYAFCGEDTNYYPRTADGKWIDPSSIFPLLPGNVPVQPEDYEEHLDLAKASLDEVKGLTEYQDQKIARLLTIISFLTAAAGVVFTKFIDLYPLHDVIDRPTMELREAPVLITYALFFVFLLLVALGALVAFHASRTRFVWKDDLVAKDRKPKSYLFYRGIIESTPASWVKGFWVVPNNVTNPSSAPIVPKETLQFEYLKNRVGETYLVAAKVADKVRFLEPAQKLLSIAIRVLVVLLISFGLTVVVVRPTHIAKSIDAQTFSTPATTAPVSVERVKGGVQTSPAMSLRLEVVPSPATTSNSAHVLSNSEQRGESQPSSAASR